MACWDSSCEGSAFLIHSAVPEILMHVTGLARHVRVVAELQLALLVADG